MVQQKPRKPAPKASSKAASSKPTPKVTAQAAPASQPMKNVTPAADPTTAFLREVDEALQQERLLAVWHQTKWFALAAVVLLVLAVAAQQAWLAWNAHKARTMAGQWYAFTKLTSDADRIKMLPGLLQTTDGGTHALAMYRQAAMQHTPAERAKVYQLVAKDNANPQWLRDLSRLNGAITLLESNPEQAKSELELLTRPSGETTEGPAYAPALELLALLSEQANDTAAARGYTEKLLQQPDLPSDMRQRAIQRLGLLGGTKS